MYLYCTYTPCARDLETILYFERASMASMLAAENEEDQDEETLELGAIHRYLTSDPAEPRYPWYYTTNHKGEACGSPGKDENILQRI